MVSRNYTVQSEKTAHLNAKSPNNNNGASPSKNTHHHHAISKIQKTIHYKQSSIGTQYSAAPTREDKLPRYTFPAPVPPERNPVPNYTSNVVQELNTKAELKSITPLPDCEAEFYPDSTYHSFAPNIGTYEGFTMKARCSTPSPNSNNLPTINECEDWEYPVDVRFEPSAKTNKCLTNTQLKEDKSDPNAKNSTVRSGRFQYVTDQPLEITDSLKGYPTNNYTGSHPDSLYRVSQLGGLGGDVVVGGSRFQRAVARARGPWRLVKWPLALVAACVALALLIYFLVPQMQPIEIYDRVNSTEWSQNDEHIFQQLLPSTKLANFNPKELEGKPSLIDPKATTSEDEDKIDFLDDDNDEKDGDRFKAFFDLFPISGIDKTTTTTIPTPIFPTNISPSIKYGNEHQDSDSNEKRTLKKTVAGHPVTDIYDDKFLTQTFAIFFNKEALETTTTQSKEKNGETKNLQGDSSEAVFTSGHQNSFGIPIEEAVKMSVTTESSAYNTKVSPTLPSMVGKNKVRSTTVRSGWNTTDDGICHSTRLSMCRGVLPYDLTTQPLIAGITTAQQLDDAVPYFDYILRSGCSPRTRQFICSLLEPECKPRGMKVLPPCRRACKAIAESCQEVISGSLELSQVFNCGQYPEEGEGCARLGGGACLPGELRCVADGSCIPQHWRCDNIADCPRATDEEDCDTNSCAPSEFKCGQHGSCIPEEWVCDGHQDCLGAEDETSCGGRAESTGDVLSAASYHPRPVRLPRPVKRDPPKPGTSIYTVTSKPNAEFESSKELLMMSDSVMPVIKPLSSLSGRKKSTTTTSAPSVPLKTSTSTSISYSTSKSSLCVTPDCKRIRLPFPSLLSSQFRTTTTTTSTTTPKSHRDDFYSHLSSPCPPNELRCVDGRCITLSQLCDRITDCTDGADEANCFV